MRGVARANYTSTSTIMRLARKMEYSGFVDMCYKLRSLVETPRQTMQEEEDFLNGFSTQSLLNYNTYTQLKVCAEKLLEQLKDEENRGAAAFLEALDRPQAPEGMCSRR